MISVKVLETNVLHASDVLYWLDASSAEVENDMLRIERPLAVSFTTRPSDLQWLHSAGKTALWRRPTGAMVAGMASETNKIKPAAPAYTLAGEVSDPEGRFLPRTFSLTLGTAAGHALALYPSPLGARFGRGGGVLGTLRFSNTGKPVPWALLTLVVTTALGDTLTFRAQSSGAGDFILPATRLPPLPEGVSAYAATLTVAALSDADAQTPIEPTAVTAMKLGDMASADVFADAINFNVVPGEIRSVRSKNKDYLAVQSV